MAVPKFRTSSGKRNMRRSHHALKPMSNGVCTNCGSVTRPHVVCGSCGFYKGKQVMKVKSGSGDRTDSFVPESF